MPSDVLTDTPAIVTKTLQEMPWHPIDALTDALADVLTDTLTSARHAPNIYPNRGPDRCNDRKIDTQMASLSHSNPSSTAINVIILKVTRQNL